jgi:hypothetical protein
MPQRTAISPTLLFSAHVPDLGFVEMGQLVLLGLGAEAQLVSVVDDLAQVVAALNLVLISPKISPILYSRVFEPLAFALKPCR